MIIGNNVGMCLKCGITNCSVIKYFTNDTLWDSQSLLVIFLHWMDVTKCRHLSVHDNGSWIKVKRPVQTVHLDRPRVH